MGRLAPRPAQTDGARPLGRHQQVSHGCTGQVPALHQHRLRPQRQQGFADPAQVGGRLDAHPGQRFGLGNIGGQHRRARQQQFGQRSLRFGLEQGCTALGPHYRVNDQRRVGLRQCRHHGFDHGRAVQHAGLDRIGAQIAQHHVDLLGDEGLWHRVDAVHPTRVLRGQRR